MNLIVSAAGQLGTAIVRQTAASDQPVQALVRPTSSYHHLESSGVELAFGDLCDAESVDAACQGLETVFATANAILPRSGDSFWKVNCTGYRGLIEACLRAGVRRFIFASVPRVPKVFSEGAGVSPGRWARRIRLMTRARRQPSSFNHAPGNAGGCLDFPIPRPRFPDAFPLISRRPEIIAALPRIKRFVWAAGSNSSNHESNISYGKAVPLLTEISPNLYRTLANSWFRFMTNLRPAPIGVLPSV